MVTERQDIVYRGPEDGAPRRQATPAPAGGRSRGIDPTTPLLFRFSALLFFAHRIHYDRRYATEVEGYPGLVVHGPLQAALLLHFAAELRGAPPDRFTFRSGAPLFDDAPFRLEASDDGGGVRLWTAREGDGPVAMSAEAGWGDVDGAVRRDA